MPLLPGPTTAAPSRRRALRGLALVLAVMLAHGWLLLRLAPAPKPPAGAAPRPAPTLSLLTRVLPVRAEPAAPPAVADATRVAMPAATNAALAAPAAPPRPAGTARPPAPRPAAPTAAPEARRAAGPAAPAAAPNTAPQNVATFAAAEPSVRAADVPVYATRLPAPASLHFQVQRGAVSGTAALHWRRDGEAYEISLETELQGMPVLGSASRGAIDADGVAPLRYADRRRAREVRAANFQRDAGLISFSGPQVQYPLLPGAQDRLSWMVQLPAIVEADVSLTRAGASVTLFIVGTRGDGEAWHFEVLGRAALELPAGTVTDALHLRREPRRPYDTRVEVWLDPARQHLPVRAVFTTVPNGQPLELTLSHSESGPL